MGSIFKDTSFSANPGLNTFFVETQAADITGTDILTATLVGALSETATKMFLDNQTDQEVYIVLVNPRLDSNDPENRRVLISLNATQQYSIESISPPHMRIDGGTKIMIYAPIAPTNGKLKIFTFGG